MKTEPTPEMRAIVDRIREQHWPNFDAAVLAAIVDTSELAAVFLRDNPTKFALVEEYEDALRNGEHLK